MAGTNRGAHAPGEKFGLSAALTTPFARDMSIDTGRMEAHAKSLLEEGCASVTLFGTTGEGASLCERERIAILDAFAAAHVDPTRLVAGISATAMEQATEQATAALEAGVHTLLVPPPFYFKDLSEEGLFAWYAELFERIGRYGPRILLYHIPQVTAVALPLPVVQRLKQGYGEIVLGVKDSGGHWPTTESFLGESDLTILVGDERHLARAVRLGGAGAISGMANVFPRELAALVETGQDNDRLSRLVDSLVKLPIIPAIKTLVGLKRRDENWNRVRPPLASVAAADCAMLDRLLRDFEQTRAV
ncbi:dihydrodipicolinate synthase family protein [Nitratireductor sp. GCM10026969]|uniref:dihydrodipicolinate synthase family protein n=1 Tax=Nitratireductor sp. GCM10026969 TaxID=3252645 RepID=UPI003612329B